MSSYDDGETFYVELSDGILEPVRMHCATREQQRSAYRLIQSLANDANAKGSTLAHARRLVASLGTILEES